MHFHQLEISFGILVVIAALSRAGLLFIVIIITRLFIALFGCYSFFRLWSVDCSRFNWIGAWTGGTSNSSRSNDALNSYLIFLLFSNLLLHVFRLLAQTPLSQLLCHGLCWQSLISTTSSNCCLKLYKAWGFFEGTIDLAWAGFIVNRSPLGYGHRYMSKWY